MGTSNRPSGEMVLILQVKKDFRELVVSARQDDFYRKHMYSNFGDIGMAVKTLVDEFQKHNSSRQNVSTLEDMQNFVENYSDFSAAQRNASKHVTLISTLSSIVDSRSLMQVHFLASISNCSISCPLQVLKNFDPTARVRGSCFTV